MNPQEFDIMSTDSIPRWAFVLAGAIFLGSTIGVTALVTYKWTDQDDTIVSPDSRNDDVRVDAYAELPTRRGRMRTPVESADELADLPERKLDYEVDIRGNMATVELVHRFINPTGRALQPVYETPFYDEASVYGVTIQVGERTIRTQLEPDNPAAEASGHNRDHWYVQSMPEVEPGQSIEVTLRYTHRLPKRAGTYRMALPLALGTRHVLTGSGTLTSRERPPGLDSDRVSVDVDLHGGMPVDKLRSVSHPLHIDERSKQHWHVDFPDERQLLNKHFRLWYRLSGDKIRVGTHVHWDERMQQGYFNLHVEPPRKSDRDDLPSRELILMLDNSSRLEDEAHRYSEQFVRQALNQLDDDDYFRVVGLEGETERFEGHSLPATSGQLKEARSTLDRLSFEDAPALSEGLDRALESPAPENAQRIVVLLTDTQDIDQMKMHEVLTTNDASARLFALGVGPHLDPYVLQEIADQGKGFYRELRPDDVDMPRLERIAQRIASPVLSDIRVDWGSFEPDEVTPGTLSDLMANDTTTLYGQYADPGTYSFKVHGERRGESKTWSLDVTLPGPKDETDAEAVRLAWARYRIGDWWHRSHAPDSFSRSRGRADVLTDRGEDLAHEHSLVTSRTSFVAPFESADDYDLLETRDDSASEAHIKDVRETTDRVDDEDGPEHENDALSRDPHYESIDLEHIHFSGSTPADSERFELSPFKQFDPDKLREMRQVLSEHDMEDGEPSIDKLEEIGHKIRALQDKGLDNSAEKTANSDESSPNSDASSHSDSEDRPAKSR